MHDGYTRGFSPSRPRRPSGRALSIRLVSVMPYYRYRTATLVGPWRDSRLKAECDAVATGQAEFAGGRGDFAWKVEGEIEAQTAETKSAGA